MSPNYKMGRFGGSSMFPPVIKGLLIANIIIYFLMYFLGAFSISGESLYNAIFSYGALFPIDSGNFYVWQVITYQFLHGGFSHIFFNMIMLWMFGVELENLWGGRRFFIFYIICGIGAALVQLFISPLLGAAGPTLGASGSIYGVFLAFALSFPDRQLMIFPLFIPIKAKYLIVILVAMDFFMGFSASSSIAHFAHIGGAATGFLLMKFGEKIGLYRFFDKLIPPKQSANGWNSGGAYGSQNSYYPNTNMKQEKAKVFKTDWFKREETIKNPAPPTGSSKFHVDGEEIDQTKIDDILDKISKSGYQNLTEREKTILFELSQKLK